MSHWASVSSMTPRTTPGPYPFMRPPLTPANSVIALPLLQSITLVTSQTDVAGVVFTASSYWYNACMLVAPNAIILVGLGIKRRFSAARRHEIVADRLPLAGV